MISSGISRLSMSWLTFQVHLFLNAVDNPHNQQIADVEKLDCQF